METQGSASSQAAYEVPWFFARGITQCGSTVSAAWQAQLRDTEPHACSFSHTHITQSASLSVLHLAHVLYSTWHVYRYSVNVFTYMLTCFIPTCQRVCHYPTYPVYSSAFSVSASVSAIHWIMYFHWTHTHCHALPHDTDHSQPRDRTLKPPQ